ncbi:MAG: class I SAM-dependent methyltransferase [Desulfobulbaceae bacterium]|nr:class I SAM-dependent methyltransferase [Desulfobulbaceae bacterium]
MNANPQSAFFDERAAHWEEKCYPPATRARLTELIALLPLRPRATTLDIGAGTGVLAPYLRQILTDKGVLISMDVSFQMMRQAASKKSCYQKGGLVQGDAMRLPFAAAGVDTVICFAAFPHFGDKGGALAEMFRVLKPGGSLAIAHLMSREELARHHGGHSSVAEDKLPGHTGMTRLFRQAGFPDPEIVDIPGRYLAKATREE